MDTVTQLAYVMMKDAVALQLRPHTAVMVLSVELVIVLREEDRVTATSFIACDRLVLKGSWDVFRMK